MKRPGAARHRSVRFREFPSVATWEAFHKGATYQGLKAIRDECSSARLVSVVEGLECRCLGCLFAVSASQKQHRRDEAPPHAAAPSALLISDRFANLSVAALRRLISQMYTKTDNGRSRASQGISGQRNFIWARTRRRRGEVRTAVGPLHTPTHPHACASLRATSVPLPWSASPCAFMPRAAITP